MQAVVLRGNKNVGAVVDDELERRSQPRSEFTRRAEHAPGVARLVAVLQQGHAGSGEFLGGGKHSGCVGETRGLPRLRLLNKLGLRRRSRPQRLKPSWSSALTARLKSCPSQSLRAAEFSAARTRGKPRLYGYGAFFAKNLSMNPVSKLPARNSGSAKICRCSGIVVWIPSTINISRARLMREIASLPSLPRTTSLAISES